MTNDELIKKFYSAFSEGNSKGMIECYHKDIRFEDPAFGKLTGRQAMKMWEMLLSNKENNVFITFDNIQISNNEGKANWTAEYLFGEKKRKVRNRVLANFKFKDDKIIEHLDTFNFWKWSKQSLGPTGFLLGWNPYFKNKIQQITNKKLDKFIEETA